MKYRRKTMACAGAALVVVAALVWTTAKVSRAQDGLASTASDATGEAAKVTPYEFVSNLDLACHRVEGGQTPTRSLQIHHINPVLREMGLDGELAYLGELEQLCAPVAKNYAIPPPELDVVRWTDLACYQAKSEKPLEVELKLSHLNPVLLDMGIPTLGVLMTRLRQVCVPVAKNGVLPPDDVRRIVEHVDVACYDIEPRNDTPEFQLHLTHLNPVLAKLGLTEQDVQVLFPTQLCVPVLKNDLKPPKDVFRLIQWLDLLKYEAERQPVPLTLQHLNPLFQDLRPFDVRLLDVEQLGVPVAKNGQIPPDDG